MKRCIVIKTNFSAVHHWPDCPIKEVAYLTMPHRHLFYVTFKFSVNHNDRDIEFISKKIEIERYLNNEFANKFISAMSCEQIAEQLLIHFNADFVSVFEDNENGAEVYNDN